MAEILAEAEGSPESWPTIPVADLGDVATGAVWRRIETFTAWRFAARTVTWTLQGPGRWRPRLRPFEIALAEIWTPDGWEEVALPAEPLGGVELACATYRLTATVGLDDTPPEDVLEAARRLATFQLDLEADGTAGRQEIGVGDFRVTSDRWPARALQLSGAADLLRPYRDLGAAT